MGIYCFSTKKRSQRSSVAKYILKMVAGSKRTHSVKKRLKVHQQPVTREDLSWAEPPFFGRNPLEWETSWLDAKFHNESRQRFNLDASERGRGGMKTLLTVGKKWPSSHHVGALHISHLVLGTSCVRIEPDNFLQMASEVKKNPQGQN